MEPFVFAVISDSHFHPDGRPAQAAWASDAAFNARNCAVVAMIAKARPAFVVHLGDVPHPVPGLAAHVEALAVAQRTYAGLGVPLHVAPGNHDVGDKPHAWLPAPRVDEAKHGVFEAHWGPAWRSFDHEGCHFVLLDAPVLNSGLPREAAQWTWLEAELAGASGRRIFAFLHYPLYLLRPDEPAHYDNLGEPARARLLELFARHEVEAAFSGHAHHFFWDRHGPTNLYVMPATSFVRPSFSEVARVGPADEFGRNDTGRLGFFFVHVHPGTRHRLELVRTDGATEPLQFVPALGPGRMSPPPCPLGVTLRHAWDQVLDVPCDNLDPFVRKEARNDLALLATWDLGARLLRLPLDDLRREATRRRLAALALRGQRAVIFAAGRPDPAAWSLLVAHRDLVLAFELIVARNRITEALSDVPSRAPELWVSALGQRRGPEEGVYFSHFPTPGFVPGDPEIAELPGVAAGVVFRVGPDEDPFDGVARAHAATPPGRRTIAQVWLQRAGEGAAFTDDRATAVRAAVAFAAARAHPDVVVVLETFADHDRGYFPRHGLIDRRGDPRPAFRVLRHLGRLFPDPGSVTVVQTTRGRAFRLGPTGLLLPEGGVDGVDLVSGAEGGAKGWPVVTTLEARASARARQERTGEIEPGSCP